MSTLPISRVRQWMRGGFDGPAMPPPTIKASSASLSHDQRRVYPYPSLPTDDDAVHQREWLAAKEAAGVAKAAGPRSPIRKARNSVIAGTSFIAREGWVKVSATAEEVASDVAAEAAAARLQVRERKRLADATPPDDGSDKARGWNARLRVTKQRDSISEGRFLSVVMRYDKVAVPRDLSSPL